MGAAHLSRLGIADQCVHPDQEFTNVDFMNMLILQYLREGLGTPMEWKKPLN